MARNTGSARSSRKPKPRRSALGAGLTGQEVSQILRQAGRRRADRSYKYPYFVSITHAGFDAQKTFLEEFEAMLRGKGAEELLNAAIRGVGDSLAENFESQGKSHGRPWPPLRESTVEKKIRQGLGGGSEPLRRGGALQRAITEFVQYHDEEGGKTFTGKVVDKPGKRGGKGEHYENKVLLNVRKTTPGASATSVRRTAELKISGPSVRHNEGFSDKNLNGETVNVPARPFWFITARERERAARHVKDVLKGQINASYVIPKQNYSRGGFTGSRKTGKPGWNKIIKNKFDFQHARKAAGGDMTNEQIVKFMADFLIKRAQEKGLAFSYKGVRYRGNSSVMSIEGQMEELRRNPWMFASTSGVIGRQDVRRSLRHETTGMLETYHDVQSGHIIHRYVIRGSNGKFKPKVVRLDSKEGLRAYMADRNSPYFVKDGVSSRQSINVKREEYADGTNLKKIITSHLGGYSEKLLNEAGAIQMHGIMMTYHAQESKRLHDLRAFSVGSSKQPGRRIARQERHDLASSLAGFHPGEAGRMLSAYEKALEMALTAKVEIDSNGVVRYQDQSMRNAVATINHLIGGRFGDTILILRAQKEHVINKYKESQGLGPNDVIDEARLMAFAGVEIDLFYQSGAKQGRKRGSVMYTPDQEREMAYYAPMGHAIMTGGRFKAGGPVSRLGPIAGKAVERMSRHNLAHNLIESIPSPNAPGLSSEARRQRNLARGHIKDVARRFLGHESPTVLGGQGRSHGTYMAYVDEPPVEMSKRKPQKSHFDVDPGRRKEMRAYVPGLSWDDRQLARNQIMWINRAIRMTTYIMERAVTQTYFESVETYIRHQLGMYSERLYAKIENGDVALYDSRGEKKFKTYGQIKEEIALYEQQRDEWRTSQARKAGIIGSEERLVGPAYFTRQRQLGWMVNYKDFERIFAGTPESISGFGISLSDRQNLASPGKAFVQSTRTYDGVPVGKVSIDAEYVPYTQVASDGKVIFGYKQSDARAAGYLDSILGEEGIERAALVADEFRKAALNLWRSEKDILSLQNEIVNIDDSDLYRLLDTGTDVTVIKRKRNKKTGEITYDYGPAAEPKDDDGEPRSETRKMWWKPQVLGYKRKGVKVPGAYGAPDAKEGILAPHHSPYTSYSSMRQRRERQAWVALWIELQEAHGDMLAGVRLTPKEFWSLPGVQKAWHYFKDSQDLLIKRQKLKKEEFRYLIYEMMEYLNEKEQADDRKVFAEMYSGLDIAEALARIRADKKDI